MRMVTMGTCSMMGISSACTKFRHAFKLIRLDVEEDRVWLAFAGSHLDLREQRPLGEEERQDQERAQAEGEHEDERFGCWAGRGWPALAATRTTKTPGKSAARPAMIPFATRASSPNVTAMPAA